MDSIAKRHRATPGQVALTWVQFHLEENIAAAAIELGDDEFAALDAAGKRFMPQV